MKKVVTATAAAALASALSFAGVSTASAEEGTTAQVTNVSCQSVTITAPANGRVIFSVDAEPPSQVADGNTVTVPFYQWGINLAIQPIVMESHHWFATTLVDDVQTDVQAGDVTGCGAGVPEPPAAPTVNVPIGSVGEVGTAQAPEAAQPSTATDAPSVAPSAEQLDVWAGVALAPPW